MNRIELLKKLKTEFCNNWKCIHFPSDKLFFKIVLSSLLIVFFIEPVLYHLIINDKSVDFSFTNKTGLDYFFYSSLIIITLGLIGYYDGIRKTGLFGFFDVLAVFTFCYLQWLGLTKYSFYPFDYKLRYIDFIIVYPIVSWVSYAIQLLLTGKRIIDEKAKAALRTKSEMYLSPDLSLSDLAKYEGKTMQDIDSETLQYGTLANTIYDAIKTINPKHKAFSIGLNGSWGAGKSSMIDLLEEEINKHNKKPKERRIVVIKFNPWLFPEQDSLIKNFFLQLSRKISNPKLTAALESYEKILSEVNVGGIRFDLSSVLGQSSTYDEIRDIIVKILQEKPEVYLIVIDDLDRLERKEVLEVAKLCRLIADFPQLIYLLAYDREYIDKLLSQEQTSDKLHSFFDKIVQIEYRLPQVTEVKIRDYLKKLLVTNKELLSVLTPEKDSNKWEEWINQELPPVAKENPYQTFLPTIRDVNRFANGLLLKVKSYGADWRFGLNRLILLELIFYKYKSSADLFYKDRKAITTELKKEIGHDINNATTCFNNVTGIVTDYSNISIALDRIAEHRSPSQLLAIFDTYFALIGFTDFTKEDAKQFIDFFRREKNNITETDKKLDNHFDNGEIEKLIHLSISHYADLVNPEKKIQVDALRKEIKPLLKYLPTYLLNRMYELGESYAEKIGRELARLEIGIRTYTDSTTDLIELIRELRFYVKVNDVSERVTYTLNQQEIPSDDSNYKQIDDCYMPGCFDLKESAYEISFTPPGNNVIHWRLGFMFSDNNTFPMRPFRHPNGCPLFHLTKGIEGQPTPDNKIFITAYSGDGIEMKGAYDHIKIESSKLIRVIIRHQDKDNIIVYDNRENKSLSFISKDDLSYFRVFAWADAKYPFSIPVTVTKLDEGYPIY